MAHCEINKFCMKKYWRKAGSNNGLFTKNIMKPTLFHCTSRPRPALDLPYENNNIIEVITLLDSRSDHYCSGMDKGDQGVCRLRRSAGQNCIENYHCIDSLCLAERYAVAGNEKLVVTYVLYQI